ncbi:hypothetical protein AB1Y20_023330 [Prymnesium parvum]|uniref:Nucleotide-diphospho-sugar transferase domain-containing protein n=1 Tax=Prymnesium parvum TaxID=97485 RepID=A0AB34JDK7_PRYPA
MRGQTVGAALLLLGGYHLIMQHAFSSSAPTGCAHRRPRRGAADTLDDRPPPPRAGMPSAWVAPRRSNLRANAPAAELLARLDGPTTVHFTFGSFSMMEFLHNWRHFVQKAGLRPALVGAADHQMFVACEAEGIGALEIAGGLDVWTYTRSRNASTAVQQGKSDFKYYRHHKRSFLELGLVKVAFLWELLELGHDILISDLDVVWIRPEWERWMSYRGEKHGRPPLPEAALQAMADVLVSTDELDEEYDAHGLWERWPHGVGWGRRSDLNTGVLFFRATNGSKAFVQAWRLAMLAKREVENTNDQFVFCDMVRSAAMEAVTSSAEHMAAWRASLGAHGLLREAPLASIGPSVRGVVISRRGFASGVPCLPDARCAPARFTLGTLPMRVFTGGHSYFMQRVHNFEGHALPRLQVLTVHFTFQYSDTPDFPHGKRQRAREAALWTADPPAYFSEGRFVRLVGPLYTAKQRVDIMRRFPEWSPQRHMHLDALQRAMVRDLLALGHALNATIILPRLMCTCDRYWGHTRNCRMPTAPEEMPMPYTCSQDALFEVKRWNVKGVRYREAAFLDHPSTSKAIVAAAVRVEVSPHARPPAAGSAEAKFTATLRPGTPMSEVEGAVLAANPEARLVEISTADVRRLCKWLGSTAANRRFNRLMRYVTSESARFCPMEDHDEAVANVPHWNWRNPYTAFNCTWGFAHPTSYPEPEDGKAPCGEHEEGMALPERSNSTTCPRVMLCDADTTPDGVDVGKWPRCNLEGYGGVDYETYGEQIKRSLAGMEGGRCPYPPGDVPGQGFAAPPPRVGLAKTE